jgi:drug/metabolite transporter (DMT)-like permease
MRLKNKIMNPLYFVFLAGLCAGFYQILRKVVSSRTDVLLSATAFYMFAAFTGLLVIWMNRNEINIRQFILNKNFAWVIIGGPIVLLIDYLVIKSYSRGLPLSIGAVVLVGLSAASAVIFGLIIGEHLNPPKIFALILILLGVLILKNY